MASLRSLSTRATLIARVNSPSISYIPHVQDRKQSSPDETLSQQKIHNFIQPRFFGSCFNDSYGSGGLFPGKRISQFGLAPSAGSAYCRYMSSTVGEGLENIESISDVAQVLKDTTIHAVANQALAVNEVAVAAADSFLPVKALQHFIDIMHNFTGFNWWASIAVTALLVRSVALPLLVIQRKANSNLGLVRGQVKEIKLQMQDKGMDLEYVAEGQNQTQKLFKKYGVTPLAPLKGLFINGPIFLSFFFAISNMAEKVPSFNNGGALWFTNLSSPDSFYIFPILFLSWHTYKGIKEIMADYVHQEMTRYWILLVRGQAKEITQHMQEKGMDPESVAEGQKQIEKLYKE
ncbi:hypothetical protein Pint_14988 [Pistacia integerrima]|uniref:Uncharacterized protein n=1 Tax=Pistacia integerrima TaxID=434235 RepID=A0ACC0ZCM1_9ROSI|nr:hypothetical protein Pint_14988 [Pistacia integerrima]